jgi:hypothetical protein
MADSKKMPAADFRTGIPLEKRADGGALAGSAGS